MKTFLICLALALGISFESFSAEVIPANQVQTGTLTFNSGTGLVLTNSFPLAYTIQPVVTLFLTLTNDNPFTINFVSLTNFSVTATANTPTNATITWVAQPGYPRLQIGTNAVQAQLLLTNTFATPFAFLPSVVISQSLTNAAIGDVPVVSTVTATGFVVQFPLAAATNQVIYWHAFGISASPGLSTVTY